MACAISSSLASSPFSTMRSINSCSSASVSGGRASTSARSWHCEQSHLENFAGGARIVIVAAILRVVNGEAGLAGGLLLLALELDGFFAGLARWR